MSKTSAPISMHVGWVSGQARLARVQNSLVLMTAKVDMGQTRLGLLSNMTARTGSGSGCAKLYHPSMRAGTDMSS